MASQVLDPVAAAAIDQITAGFDTLRGAGLDPADAKDAAVLVRELEAIGRRARAAQVQAMDRVDRRGLHRVDGHASVKVFVRHHAQLSKPQASARARAVKALRDLPAVREGHASGRIGSCQIDRIARVHANPRVQLLLCAQDEALATLAARVGYEAFDRELSHWERLMDEDGTRDRNQRNHHNRDATLLADYDGSWNLKASCASLQGAQLRTIFDRFIEAEWHADWDQARAEHGDAATLADLARTDNQRRYDALHHIFDTAATGHTTRNGGAPITTDLVIDQETFEREASRLAGGTPDPRTHPLAPSGAGLGLGTAPAYCSQTTDGHWVEPTESVAAALIGHIRRVVVGADRVVTHQGRRQRLFTGPSRDAAMFGACYCAWPGCLVPAHHCQIDHLQPWAQGGRTNPGNGAPLCGRHNRFKHTSGYQVTRDQHGDLHTFRPDGTELE